jgi:hypothetical protein
MSNSVLPTKTLEKDLGIYVSNELEWSQHINIVIGKANRQLGLIKSSFKYLDEFSLKLLYK